MIFSVLGGDKRLTFLAAALRSDGHEVRFYEGGALKAAIDGADCVILPLPAEKPAGFLNAPGISPAVSISEICRTLTPGQKVFAGMPVRELTEAAESAGAEVCDYSAVESFAEKNAALTAEGALAIIIDGAPFELYSRRALVTGFGRVSRALVWRLNCLGANVTVAARSPEQRAAAEARGYGSADISDLSRVIGDFDVIVNTVPAGIFGEQELEQIKPDCFFLDLASAPGGIKTGVDFDRAVTAPGIPGRFSPMSAGEAIKSTIYNILFDGAKQ